MIDVHTADAISHAYLALKNPDIVAFFATQTEGVQHANAWTMKVLESAWRAYQEEQKAKAL